MSEVIKNRYEFVVLFDVENWKPKEILMQGICQELTGKWFGSCYGCLY